MRLVTVTLWLLAGAALTGGVYWSFLITPESTGWSLAASALLVITAAFLLALTISGAAVGWRHGVSTSHIRAAVAGVPGIVPAAAIAALFWWLANSVTDGMTLYNGPIRAWFIASLGWDDVSWLFTGVSWLAAWLRWVVGPVLALSLLGAILSQRWRGLASVSWITRALAPLPLATATLLFAAGMNLEEIGGDGPFVRPGNTERFYTRHSGPTGTLRWRPVWTEPLTRPNTLYHPVKAPPA